MFLNFVSREGLTMRQKRTEGQSGKLIAVLQYFAGNSLPLLLSGDTAHFPAEGVKGIFTVSVPFLKQRRSRPTLISRLLEHFD